MPAPHLPPVVYTLQVILGEAKSGPWREQPWHGWISWRVEKRCRTETASSRIPESSVASFSFPLRTCPYPYSSPVTHRSSPIAHRPSPVTRHPRPPPLLGMLSKPLGRSLRMTTLRVRWQPRETPRQHREFENKGQPSESLEAAPGPRALCWIGGNGNNGAGIGGDRRSTN